MERVFGVTVLDGAVNGLAVTVGSGINLFVDGRI